MRVNALLLIPAFLALLAQAAPVTESTNTARSAEASLDDCPIYNAPDAGHLSLRDLERRAGEENFFRFEDPSVVDAGANILQLAPRAGGKNYDDQAYKWISTDISKVTRGKISGRVSTLYVLPTGTRAAVLGPAKDFDTSSAAKTAVDFVTKDHEPGDVGINGVQKSADGTLPLDVFRNKVIRTVVKTVSASAGGKATYTTITKGKKASGASKADQAALDKIC